ncbi:hypothetical protein DPMN_091834 [Dreissena polymorpha]|nr:hypothetical protein DPMN_091834 [Dreissena polymorpha]
MVRQDRHQGRYREFRRDDGGPRPKTSDTLGEVREVYSKRQDMQGLRSQSADSEKEKQMKRDAFRKHFRAERGSSETISRVHNQNITVPSLKLSSNNISDISKSRFDDRTESQDIVNSRDSSLSRDYERHCRGSRGSTPSLLSADIRYARKSPNAQRGMEKTENNNGSRTCTYSLSNKRHTLTGDYNDKRMSPTKTVQKSPQPNKTRSLDKQCLSPYFDRKHTANSLSPDMALGWSPRPNR